MAGPGARIRAFAFDYLVILAWLVVLSLVGFFLTAGPLKQGWSALLSSPQRVDLLAFMTTVLPVTLYFALSEASKAGSTWGKKRVGLGVVGPRGTRLSLPRSVLRSSLKFLPWQMAHTAMLNIPGFPMSPGEPPRWSIVLLSGTWILVAVYLVGLTPLAGGRTLYDRMSGARVVTVGTDPT